MKKILIILGLVSLQTVSQDVVKVDVSNPQSTIYTHFYFLQSSTYQPKKAAQTIYGLQTNDAIDKAIKIKRVLDGKGLYIDFTKIPNNPNYKDSTDVPKTHKYVLFPNRMPQIYVEKIEGKWYYSKETVANIDAIYNSVFPWYVNKLQDMIPNAGHKIVLGLEVWQWFGIIILLILSVIIFAITKKLVYFILQKVQQRITHSIDIELNKVTKKLAHPVSLLIALTFLSKFWPGLQLSLAINKWAFLAINIWETIFWIYIFLKLVKVVMAMYSEFTKKTESKLDDQLVPILHNFLSGIVIIIGIFKFLHIFGVDTTTLLTGATIGGLAFALASQDTVKNLIGTLMIFLDKPFHIGDWIEADTVKGTVEQVGFRSTRIRAADTSVFQIPNSKLSEITINNKGIRLFRRYEITLGVRYDTPPELIEAFVVGIRKLVIAHPEIREEGNVVEFSGFGDSALNIMVNVYFKSLDWAIEQQSKHKLHMAILKLAAAMGVEFAFPSTTVMIEQFPEKANNLLPKYNTKQEDFNSAIDTIVAHFAKENPYPEDAKLIDK